ncbi:hypothetical protein P8452_35669 [Trifolium repens]|nr:hypothetical protein P8452_35669 [Trifolium repens]
MRPDEPHPQPACGRLACSIDWSFLSVELGFVFGLGIIIGPILFWKLWRWTNIHSFKLKQNPKSNSFPDRVFSTSHSQPGQ